MTGRRQHTVAVVIGALIVLAAVPVASVLGPAMGGIGYLLVLSALVGTVLAIVGRRQEPPRYGRAALALTVIPACLIAVMLAFLALMVLALGGGNPNS